MSISRIIPYSYLPNKSNINFKSKVTWVLNGELSQDLKDKVDVFEETHENAKFIGEGLFSRAYHLNGTDVVIKESLPADYAKKNNGDFSQEARVLKNIPNSLKNSQRLVGNVKTEKGNYYLLSTLVVGSKPNAATNAWKSNHFKSLFKCFYKLDANGIYHNDLNRGNCLIANDGTANLIDYQYAESFNINKPSINDEKLKFPKFLAPSNAQMFEMANLPFYLVNVSEKDTNEQVKQVLKDYLVEKSDYCKNRASYLKFKNANSDMVKYEQLQSRFFKNPTDDIIELQAMKLQFLYAFRQAFSINDVNNDSKTNIISSIPFYLYAAASAKLFADRADELSSASSNPEYKEFLKYEKDYGLYWRDKLVEDLSGSKISSNGEYGTFKWILRNAQLNPHWKNGDVDPADDLSERFKNSANMEFGSIVEIPKLVSNRTTPIRKCSFDWGSYNVKEDFRQLDKCIKESTYAPPTAEGKKKMVGIEKAKKRFIESFQLACYSIDEQRIIACVPAAIKALYNASLLKNEIKKQYGRYNDYLEKYYLDKQNELAKKAVDVLSNASEFLYNRAITGINGGDYYYEECLKYEKLNEFDMQNAPQYDITKPLTFKK